MKKTIYFLLSLTLFSSSLFANDRILQNPTQPYQSLGYLEHKTSTKHGFLKVATLGLLRNRKYERMTRKLNKQLLKEARKKYGADAIANVTYWPLPESGTPIDVLYARAEMISFKKFPVFAEKSTELPAVEVQQGTL